jgi:hypothetical protein
VKLLPLITALTLSAMTANAAPDPGADWDWQLSENISSPRGVQVFDVDPDNVTAAQIAALRLAGIYTICYVSVGTMETYRDDHNDFPRKVIGWKYEDWPDEYFLDIRENDVAVIMAIRFAKCAAKGFNAVEPDNLDVYQNKSGFDITAEDTLEYIDNLIYAAHNVGLEIGQKNVGELTPYLVDKLDFVITESCYQDGWCDEVLPYIKAGKPVFDAEYTDRPINFNKACKYAENMGISMILKDRDLTSTRRVCK